MKKGFISEFIKERKVVGAIAPSSKHLMKKMLSRIDFTEDINIIELGPGTGIFTAEILNRMSKGSKLILFEINSLFYHRLKSKFNDYRLRIVSDSAERMHDHLLTNELNKAQVVISSLPLLVANGSSKLRPVIYTTGSCTNAPTLIFISKLNDP